MAMNEVKHLWFPLFILISISTISGAADPDCVYTVYVQTGSGVFSGTNSNISLTLYDASKNSMRIDNLVTWGGLMGPGHDYFEKGNLDMFAGTGSCLKGSVCAMKLTSDGAGSLPRWYVDFVQVTVTGLHKYCSWRLFTVQRWLDSWPHGLTATINYCKKPVVIDDESGSPSHIAMVQGFV